MVTCKYIRVNFLITRVVRTCFWLRLQELFIDFVNNDTTGYSVFTMEIRIDTLKIDIPEVPVDLPSFIFAHSVTGPNTTRRYDTRGKEQHLSISVCWELLGWNRFLPSRYQNEKSETYSLLSGRRRVSEDRPLILQLKFGQRNLRLPVNELHRSTI